MRTTPYSNLDDIMLAVCLACVAARMDMTESDLLGREVTPEISAARAVFVGLARMHTLCSYPEIAARLNRARHNGSIHALDGHFVRALKTDSHLPKDRAIRRIIAWLDSSWRSSGLHRRPSRQPTTPQRTEARDVTCTNIA